MQPSPTPSSAPADASQTPLPHLTQKLMEIVDELTHLLEQEIPLVNARDYKRQGEMLRRKQELTLDYQATLKSLSESAKNINEADRATLRAKGQKLETLAKENATAVALAHSATERLLSVVMDEVRKDTMKDSGYSAQGYLTMAQRDSTKPVACNQSV